MRRPEDEQYFRFALSGKPAHVPEYAVNESFYKIPFEAEFFDFVFPTSVFEHVQDYEMALSAVARVLRPGGVAIHTFPARYSPIEPHICVPLVGAIQYFPWYLLWAALGIRNQFQQGLGPIECAKVNRRYANTGLNYLTVRYILRQGARYFRKATLSRTSGRMGDHGSLSLKGRLIHGLPLLKRPFRWLYNRCCTVVLYLRK